MMNWLKGLFILMITVTTLASDSGPLGWHPDTESGPRQVNVIGRKLLSVVDREQSEDEMEVEHFQMLFQKFTQDKDIQRILKQKSGDNEYLLFWLDLLNTTDVRAIEELLYPERSSEHAFDVLESEGQEEQILEELKTYVATLEELQAEHGDNLEELEAANEIMEFFELGNSVIEILRQMEKLEKLNQKYSSEDLDVVKLEQVLAKKPPIVKEIEEHFDPNEEMLMPLDANDEEDELLDLDPDLELVDSKENKVETQDQITDDISVNEDQPQNVHFHSAVNPMENIANNSEPHSHSHTVNDINAKETSKPESVQDMPNESRKKPISAHSPLKSDNSGTSVVSTMMYVSMAIFGVILIIGVVQKRAYLGRLFWNRFMSRIRPFHYRRN